MICSRIVNAGDKEMSIGKRLRCARCRTRQWKKDHLSVVLFIVILIIIVIIEEFHIIILIATHIR